MIKNKKIVFIIFIILLAILMFAITLITGINQQKEEKYEARQFEENMKEYEEFREKFHEETILPRKIIELYKYDGQYDNEDLFRNMKVFADYIDYLKRNIKLEDANDFYQKNSDEVKSIIGITSYEEFEKFILEVQNNNIDADEFKYAAIEVGSSYEESGYFVFNINFYYGESEEEVPFTVSFANSKVSEIKVKYQFNVE